MTGIELAGALVLVVLVLFLSGIGIGWLLEKVRAQKRSGEASAGWRHWQRYFHRKLGRLPNDEAD